MELKFEPCVLIDLELRCKRPQKKRRPLIFINLGVKKFIVKNTQKKIKKIFDV
jgi:hypothetical protein